MDNISKEKLLNKSKWLRGLFMLVFLVIIYIVTWLIILIAGFQFIWNLFAETTNEPLKNFAQKLGNYFHSIINFLTFNTEVKPFPFTPWPEELKKEDTK